MTTWTAISKNKHANCSWKPKINFEFARKIQITEVLVTELGALLPHFVLGFIKNEEGYQLIALLGLGGANNLYVNLNHQWVGDKVPESIRRYPFQLMPSSDADEKIVCIANDHISADSEQGSFLLFDDSGELAAESAEMVNLLKQYDKDLKKTQLACNALADAEIMMSWPLKIERGEGMAPITFEGLYRIDETALNKLEEKTFSQLRDSLGLVIAYAQLFSINQLKQLGTRADFIEREYLENTKQKEDLAGLFSADDGSLNFDAINLD